MAGLVPAIHDLNYREVVKTWMPGTRPGMTKSGADAVEPIDALRRTEEQIGFLGSARALGEQLAGVPEHRIAVRALVDREVALEHATRWAERRDAGFDVWPPSVRERLRGRRFGRLFETEAADAHAEPAEFYVDIRPLGERLNRLLPTREDVLALVGIDADRPAAVIEHNLRIGERIGEARQRIDLGMVDPGIERIPHPMQHREAFAEFLVRQHAGRR